MEDKLRELLNEINWLINTKQTLIEEVFCRLLPLVEKEKERSYNVGSYDSAEFERLFD